MIFVAFLIGITGESYKVNNWITPKMMCKTNLLLLWNTSHLNRIGTLSLGYFQIQEFGTAYWKSKHVTLNLVARYRSWKLKLLPVPDCRNMISGSRSPLISPSHNSYWIVCDKHPRHQGLTFLKLIVSDKIKTMNSRPKANLKMVACQQYAERSMNSTFAFLGQNEPSRSAFDAIINCYGIADISMKDFWWNLKLQMVASIHFCNYKWYLKLTW